jgi:hypothetical protein
MPDFANDHDADAYEKTKAAMEQMFKVLNVMGNSKPVKAAVKDVIRFEHRTLQQSFFKDVICAGVEAFADMDEAGHTDARNMVSCKYGSLMHNAIDDPYIPFV